jgi:hypothetical protein
MSFLAKNREKLIKKKNCFLLREFEELFGRPFKSEQKI